MMSNYENSTLQQNLIPIYEFSRGFDNPHFSEKYQRWVSGGYLQEVASQSHPVPEEIQHSVKRGDFRINDNYPPDNENKEIALIARDFGKYSVLAVATGEYDDKCLRQLVAYRYFWLEKINLNIDGIATLLYWWLNQDKPCFDFTNGLSANQQTSRKIDDLAQIHTLDESIKIFQEEFQKFSYFVPKITVYPYIFSHEIEERALHLVTLHLHQKYRVPLAWAWNVTWLEKSASSTLTLINCVDEKTLNYISQDVKSSQKPMNYIHNDVPAKPLYPNPKTQKQPPTNIPVSTPKISDINKTDVAKIKSIIQDIADSIKVHNIDNLIDFIKKIPIQYWRWEEIRETSLLNSQNVNKTTARYQALLVLLGYKSSVEWLEWLPQNRKYTIKNYRKISLQLQEQIESIAKSHPEVHQQLIVCVFKGISQLLIDYQQTNDENQKQNIEWLLLKSDSIWSRSFISYGQNIFYQLQRKEPNQSHDEFYQKLLYSFRQWEQKNYRTTHNVYISQDLINLAELFQKAKNYDLSALLYQLGQGSVPIEVYKQVVQDIIPLNEDSDRPNKNSRMIIFEKLNKLSPLIKITGGLLILFILAWLFSSRNSRTQQLGIKNCKISNDEKCLVSSNLEKNIFFWERTKNSQDRRDSIREIKNQITEFEAELNNNNQKDKSAIYYRTYSFLQELLLPKITLQSNDLDKQPIREDSPSPDITAIQKTLGFSQAQASGKFDENTRQAVEQFQRQRQLNTVGYVDSQTWNAMQGELTKKQLQKTVEVLRIILQTQNDNQIEDNIRKLQDCKQNAFTYLNCVENLQKEIQASKPNK